jgi:carbon-monoxide dehydrogenase medium subunit
VKPPPFGYARPQSVPEALAALAALGPEAKVLAGGQSLLPLLSMRLAAPSHLVDINRLTELAYVRVADGEVPASAAGAGPGPAAGAGPGPAAGAGPGPAAGAGRLVRVGALARQAEVLADAAAARVQPLLAKALRFVAHPAIRNRGTVVGSLVHADPAGELPAVLALLGGTVRVAGLGGERAVAASEFFLGPLESDVQPGELATEAVFPALTPGTGTGFAELSRRRGDYAVCAVAALAGLRDDGRVAHARAAYLPVGPRPVLVDLTEAVAGLPGDARDFGVAAALARARVEPVSDLHASAAYRRHLAGVLTERALREALAEARARQPGGVAHG